MKKGLKDVSLDAFGLMNESLCTAMKDGLGMNTTLESLELNRINLTEDNSALWYRALPFLCTNKALKCLVVNLERNVAESHAAALRTDIVAMLQVNTSLETLFIHSYHALKAEDYVALITALQQNTTLRTLILQHERNRKNRRLTDDEDKQIAVLLQNNYALERLPDIEHQGGDVSAVLQLNGARRWYLVQDGSSISKGVKVLSAVSSDINCVFFHLLENPRLCDRSAVETSSDSTDSQGSRGSTSPANHSGKREHNQD